MRPLTGPVQTIKATPLMIGGVLYISTQDNAYAMDARTGRELWHYTLDVTGRQSSVNRGMAALGDTLYFETPDCHLVALDISDGKQRWNKAICDMDQFYYGVGGAGRHQEPRHDRRERRRHGQSRLSRGARSCDRRTAMALVHRAADDGRTRLGHLAERRSGRSTAAG